jgi:hypothetical protein
MRSVQFRVLNFERLCQVLNDFIAVQSHQQPSSTAKVDSDGASSQREYNAAIHVNGSLHQNSTQQPMRNAIQTPEEMSLKEKILKPPAHLARRTFAFGSLGRARLDPD